ncbi:MAG: phosphoglucosamine mutase [Fibrobacterota bacterium]
MSQLPIMSVSGIRGTYPDPLTDDFLAAMAYVQTKKAGGGDVIIGRDTRPSGANVEAAVCRGIRAAGGTPISIGIAPTPTTCFAVRHFEASAGIIITASHNPLPYNGYKMVHREGRLLSASEGEEIYEMFRRREYPSPDEMAGFISRPERTLDACAAHLDVICAMIDIEAVAAADITVAVDSINGAAGVVFPALLERLGVKWVGVHTKIDGDFVHNPEPRPEHLGDLADLLRSSKNTWGGFAYDPDADRLATMGENGESISEEMTLVLAMDNVLAKTPGPVATNLSTSMVIDDVARAHGVSLYRTKIGEANVVDAIRENNCPIGGEGNGGVIYPAVTLVRDGLVATALILELMAQKKRTLTELTRPWTEYPLIKEKIELGNMNPATVLEKIDRHFSSGEAALDRRDGIKITYPDGWVHLRASNTEPILRCYAEGTSQEVAQKYAAAVMEII